MQRNQLWPTNLVGLYVALFWEEFLKPSFERLSAQETGGGAGGVGPGVIIPDDRVGGVAAVGVGSIFVLEMIQQFGGDATGFKIQVFHSL